MANGQRYARAKLRILELTDGIPDGQAIDATPEWDLRDLISHLDGVAADVADGNVERYSQPPWTAVQVEQRAGRSRADLLIAWDESARRVESVLDDPVAHGLDPMFELLPLLDLLIHEQDIREAVGLTGTLDPDDWPVIAARRRQLLDQQIALAELPPLEVRTPEGDSWVVGGDAPVATVVADRFELCRSLEGRRTPDIVREFAWSADPEPYLGAWVGMVFRWPGEASAAQ